MKLNKTFIRLLGAILPTLALFSCNDETSIIGETFASGEVIIECDSNFTITGKPALYPEFDARSSTKLVGEINVPEYGSMRCSFLSQMLASTSLGVPDSIGVDKVDSLKMIVTVPRSSLTGDSLAPQQLSIYKLHTTIEAKQSYIEDPSKYYNTSDLLGKHSYTLSMLGRSDSLYNKTTTIEIPIKLSLDMAKKIFNEYRNNPDIFQWPSSFNKYFPGIYVEPSFGRSCIANVRSVQTRLYYHYITPTRLLKDSVYIDTIKTVRDSVTLFTTAPEVSSLNHLTLNFSDALISRINAGENIIVTPTGYNIDIRFPLPEVVNRYKETTNAMTVLDNLTLSIPASEIKNDYGISTAPTLLMVKTSELKEFFENNKAPDGETSFWAKYNSDTQQYEFDSMRKYLQNAIENSDDINESDYQFTLVPISTILQYKQVGYNQTESFVAACTPYLEKPTMTLVDLENAKIKLTFSLQKIN